MKKFLLSLSLAASTVGALPAADYVPIFREDWVWKYTDELYGNSVDTERTCREYEMCFDGAKRASASGRGLAAANLSQLAPGVYVVRASDGSSVKTSKMVV